jgi:hypothetical protein
LDLFLLSFGPIEYDEDITRLLLGSRDRRQRGRSAVQLETLRPYCDIQEQQMKALQQRYKELFTGLKHVRKDMSLLKQRKRQVQLERRLSESQPSLSGSCDTLPSILTSVPPLMDVGTESVIGKNEAEEAMMSRANAMEECTYKLQHRLPHLASIPENV